MINIIADTHTHTLACDHAYSTALENISVAAEKGLSFLSLTEHGPSMAGAPTWMHFMNLKVIPRITKGIVILRGAEANIIDTKGTFDLNENMLKELDWVIASMHTPVFEPAGRDGNTVAWLAVAENPHVDVIGHCGDSRYSFDEETVLRAFKKHGKIVEINSHSFNVRPGSHENCARIAKICAEIGLPVVVSSDAHFCSSVGNFNNSLNMLMSIGFPEELILNADYDRFLAVAREKAPDGLEGV